MMIIILFRIYTEIEGESEEEDIFYPCTTDDNEKPNSLSILVNEGLR